MASTDPHRCKLRILATSDVHMQLLSHDYFADEPSAGSGLQALEAAISDLRQQALAEDPPRHTILVDNGDMLQGNVLGDYLAETHTPDAPHPVAEVMNRFGYAAMGLGNHDLDFGFAYLEAFARSFSGHVISANLHPEQPRDWLRNGSILDIAGLRVGLTSVLPPGSLKGLFAKLEEPVRLDPIRKAVRRSAKHLRAQGADILIGLLHTGFGPDTAENALQVLAKEAGLDAIVGGHSHHLFPEVAHVDLDGVNLRTGTLYDVPTVMPGAQAEAMGCIDLDIVKSAETGWACQHSAAWLVPAARPLPRKKSKALQPIHAAHVATCARLNEEIAHCTSPLRSYFTRVNPTTLSAVVAAAQADAIRPFAKAAGLEDMPLLSAVSPGRAGGRGGAWNYTNITTGAFTTRHLSELSLHANLIWAVDISGAELRDWLEKAASAFGQIDGQGDDGVVDPHTPAFDFDSIYGINYTIDPTRPARYPKIGAGTRRNASRIVSLTYHGVEVADDDRFLVAVNSYRACGGGNFPGLDTTRPILRPDLTAAEVMRSYVTGRETLGDDESADAPWAFDPACKGARTWFATGPGALSCLGEIAHLSPGTPQLRDSGFLHIPITL